MISIDITLIIQIVNFLVSLCIINCLIIKPIRGNLMKRQSLVDADVNEAEQKRINADIATKEHGDVIAKVRAGIVLQKHSAKDDAESNAHSILDEYTQKARDIRSESSAIVRDESERALKDLEAKVSGFTQSALAKVLD